MLVVAHDCLRHLAVETVCNLLGRRGLFAGAFQEAPRDVAQRALWGRRLLTIVGELGLYPQGIAKRLVALLAARNDVRHLEC